MASQDENRAANYVGSRAYWYMAICVSSSILYAIALLLFYASLRVLSQRRESTSRARKLLLTLSCFMFLMTTGLFVANIGQTFLAFSWARDTITENTPAYKDRWSANAAASVPYFICQVAFEVVNFIIGDAIIIWRAAVLWPHSHWIQGGLGLLLIGDVAVSLYEMVTFSIIILHPENDIAAWSTADAARILTSMGINFVASLCIAVKAWQFRRTLRLGFSKAVTKGSFANRVLTLLVECGLIFCAVQVFYAIYMLVIDPKAGEKPFMHPLSLFTAVAGPFFSFFAGMYPSIVILVMAKQQSIFGTNTFVACSHDTPTGNETGMHDSRALSTLHFVTVQESTGQVSSDSQSTARNVEDSSRDGASFGEKVV